MIEAIRKEAKKKGMTIVELEQRAGLARGAIYKLNTSSPTLVTLEKIAEALGIKVSTLIERISK